MMQIPCPWCGPREQNEFECGGQAHIKRPALPEAVSDRDWVNYLHVRENPIGVHHERWLHLHGCGQWFHIARDTVTHNIVRVYGMHEHAATTES
jgi:heterotetrameric sarcosine oxidase delta subunit